MSIATALGNAPIAGHEFATIGGGCFWCLEAVYEELDGVIDVESGYSGGYTTDPDYASVCDGNTGHAEVVRIEFDPAVISYQKLLEVFFAIHDPTTLNRQGNDVGTQYRSVIYFHSEKQKEIALSVLDEVRSAWSDPVVTELSQAGPYWRAEPYHQEYFTHHPNQGYCAFVVGPKVAKFRKTFASLARRSALRS
jgi:peptide-methionine (S)-S-oxide reductase